MTLREELKEQAERLEGLLDRVPEPMARQLRERIGELRELLLEQRPPRFALIGRRGAGKSSLINAFFGHAVAEVGHEKATTARGRWFTHRGDLGAMDILDSRGIQEGSRPEGAEEQLDPVESLNLAIDEKGPDALLFLIKANEVDAAVDADLDALEAVSERIHKRHGYAVPVVAVLTHCDAIEPKNTRLHLPEEAHPEDLREKKERIERLEAMIASKITERKSLKDQFVAAHGISAYQSWRRDGSRRADERWRIEELVDFLLDELPEQARVEFVRLSQVKTLQHRIANRLTNIVSTLCAGLAATPIPVADIAPITSMQISLISGIGYVSGRRMEVKAATEFMGAVGANIGAAVAMREAARALAKLLAPGLGHAISAGVAFAGTKAIGKAAAVYFIDGVDMERAKSVFESTRSKARQIYDRNGGEDPEQLEELLSQDLSEEEIDS